MQVVVFIILLMVGFIFLVKLTYHGLVGKIALCALGALFVVFSTDIAASQSKTQIDTWLSSPDLMLDAAVLLTIDVAAQLAFCFLMARQLEKPLPRWSRVLLVALLWFPGLMIFPALMALLTELIFSMTGADFATIGYGLAGALLILGPLAAIGFKWLLPEDDIRLELIFLASLLTAALGVAATVNGRTAAIGTNSVEWGALGTILLLLILGTAAGIMLNIHLTNKKTRKI